MVAVSQLSDVQPSQHSQWRRSIRTLWSIRMAPLGLFLILIALLMAASADVLSPYDPNIGDFRNTFSEPSREHLLGTDELGRDILSRMLHGSRVSLQVAFGATIVSTIIGVLLGTTAGYYGRWLDDVLMRVTDALLAFPSLILALAIASALDPGVRNIILALALTSFSSMARLARASTLALKELDFVEAARASGARDARIILRHLLPNGVSPIIVQFTLMVSWAILAEASLSFLGVGVRPPQASWGGMLRTGFQFLEVAPWISIVPGILIFLTVLGFNLFGDGLRAALDPRLRDIGTG